MVTIDFKDYVNRTLIYFRDKSDDTDLPFPSTLSFFQRKYIHIIASKYGLKHASRGEGDQRFVTIYKPHVRARNNPRNIFTRIGSRNISQMEGSLEEDWNEKRRTKNVHTTPEPVPSPIIHHGGIPPLKPPARFKLTVTESSAVPNSPVKTKSIQYSPPRTTYSPPSPVITHTSSPTTSSTTPSTTPSTPSPKATNTTTTTSLSQSRSYEVAQDFLKKIPNKIK